MVILTVTLARGFYSGKLMYINAAHVVNFMAAEEGGSSISLTSSPEVDIYVQETPNLILAQIPPCLQ